MVGSFGLALYKSPILTGIFFLYFPVMIICLICISGATKRAAIKKMMTNKEFGGFQEECLSALKLIISFGNEEVALDIYKEKAKVASVIAMKANRAIAITFGIFRLLSFGFFVYKFYLGSLFVIDRTINPATDKVFSIIEIITCSHALMGGIMQFFKSADNIGSYKSALVMGASVFKVIERVPAIRDDPSV